MLIEYTNRNKRNAAYNELCLKLREVDLDAIKDTVLKINKFS